MNEITIKTEMTLREYDACQDALRYGEGVPIVIWAVLATGAASLASSAALTWGTPASILAGMALAAFIFSIYFSSLITATRRRQAYKKYKLGFPIWLLLSSGCRVIPAGFRDLREAAPPIWRAGKACAGGFAGAKKAAAAWAHKGVHLSRGGFPGARGWPGRSYVCRRGDRRRAQRRDQPQDVGEIRTARWTAPSAIWKVT